MSEEERIDEVWILWKTKNNKREIFGIYADEITAKIAKLSREKKQPWLEWETEMYWLERNFY